MPLGARRASVRQECGWDISGTGWLVPSPTPRLLPAASQAFTRADPLVG